GPVNLRVVWPRREQGPHFRRVEASRERVSVGDLAGDNDTVGDYVPVWCEANRYSETVLADVGKVVRDHEDSHVVGVVCRVRVEEGSVDVVQRVDSSRLSDALEREYLVVYDEEDSAVTDTLLTDIEQVGGVDHSVDLDR